MADTLAEIKEREFHARQAARGEERHQRAAPSSQQRRSEPVGAGGWLAIGILVALAIYASATGAGRGRGSRSLGMIAPHARSVDELEMLLELDKMLAGDLSDLAPRKPRSKSPYAHCSASSCEVGAHVKLTPNYHEYADARSGPLREGQEGVVVGIDRRVQVQASGRTWWYDKQAIVSAESPRPTCCEARLTGSGTSSSSSTHGERKEARSPQQYGTIAIVLAIVLGAAAVYSHRIKQQQARAEAEYNRREERRIKELDEFRQKEVERMRQERIAREKKAAAMAAVHARSREAAVTIQRAWWEKKERQRVVAQSEGRQEWVQQMQHSADETARQRAERLRYYGRRCVPAAAEGGDHPQDGTDDPLNGGSKRYVPQQQAGAPVTIGLWENIVVSGPAAQNATGRAHLDTGNASHTVITRRFAESIGLVDPEGLPFLVPRAAVEYITAGGIVAGATTRQVVVPKVTFAIKGVEVTSKVTITGPEGGLGVREHRWDVLVCMNDIKELERSGAKFRPCELD
jgi:gamma-glutamylcyclotransferase (GGCT)/AIG2-like uncharacterized protein YtfP